MKAGQLLQLSPPGDYAYFIGDPRGWPPPVVSTCPADTLIRSISNEIFDLLTVAN